MHSHFALQLTITEEKPFTADFHNNSVSSRSLLIRNNVKHKLHSDEILVNLLFNPCSSAGHFLFAQLKDHNWIDYHASWLDSIKASFSQYYKQKIDQEQLVQSVSEGISQIYCLCRERNHFDDQRISDAVSYLEEHSMEVVPVEEIASVCSLSPDRFLHLFKEKTGITYRRFQLWNKLHHAFQCVLSGMSLTDSAYEAGFADSSHFSRTFRETFGELPGKIFKMK